MSEYLIEFVWGSSCVERCIKTDNLNEAIEKLTKKYVVRKIISVKELVEISIEKCSKCGENL